MASREKLLIRKRRYHERHLDQDHERSRLWRAANAEYAREQNRLWRAAHPDAGYEGVKRWRIANPEQQAMAARASACNRRAKAAGAAGHISRADVSVLWERQPVCISCGKGRGVDHILAFKDGGANVPANLQNLCVQCNVVKNGKLTLEKARAIRAARSSGEKRADVAARFGISPAMVWNIETGKAWKE